MSTATLLLLFALGGSPAAKVSDAEWAVADRDYAAFRERVAAGGHGTLYVGVKARPTYDDCWLPSGSLGLKDGAYKCWSANGKLVMSDTAPARSVPVAKTFRAVREGFRQLFDSDHTCNVCGRHVSRIAGWNRDGTHTHRCSCGNEWRH